MYGRRQEIGAEIKHIKNKLKVSREALCAAATPLRSSYLFGRNRA